MYSGEPSIRKAGPVVKLVQRMGKEKRPEQEYNQLFLEKNYYYNIQLTLNF